MGTFWRQLQSRLDYVRFVYRGELSWLVALALFAVTLPLAWLPNEVVVGGALVGGAVAIVGLVKQGSSVLRDWRRTSLIDLGRPIHAPVRPQWDAPGAVSRLTRHSPHGDETAFWWDRDVNAVLWHRSVRHSVTVVGRVGAGRYHLPTRLQEIAGRGLRYGKIAGKRRRGNRALPIRFNGRLLRLATEPTVAALERGELEFERVTYFDGECSNELWTAGEIARGSNGTPRSIIHDYACDREGSMLALENARVANIVGISVLAISADNHAVVVRQSRGNSVAPDAWAASGSGSLERRDLQTAGTASMVDEEVLSRRFDASSLLLAGMLRELREESLVQSEEIDRDSARLTAYWRWAQRAMKPEFSGIVRLRVDAATLAGRTHRGGESAFSTQVSSVPLDELLASLERGENPLGEAMNPSAEVALLAAAEFLAHPIGQQWRAMHAR